MASGVRYYPVWKDIKNVPTRDFGTCSRCNNNEPYKLVYDANEIGFPGILSFKYDKVYAYKCPVCPEFWGITTEMARSVIGESK